LLDFQKLISLININEYPESMQIHFYVQHRFHVPPTVKSYMPGT
jgi:hypothetical protein